MADFFKNLDKNIKDWHILVVLGLLVLGYVLYEYCGKQNMIVNNFQRMDTDVVSRPTAPEPRMQQTTVQPAHDPSHPTVLAVGQVQFDNRAPGPITTRPTDMDPALLLPDSNNTWGSIRPDGGMDGINFLTNIPGIGMQNQTLRNANLQLRADPQIPPATVPNMQNMTCLCAPQSTIEGDNIGLKVC